MTLRKTGEIPAPYQPSDANGRTPSTAGLGRPWSQNISILPLEYASTLNAVDLGRRAQSDPFHAFIPIFAHAAFSEVAFLNLIENLVAKQMDRISVTAIAHRQYKNGSFENLQYIESILNKHATQLRQCLATIKLLAAAATTSDSSYFYRPRGKHSSLAGVRSEDGFDTPEESSRSPEPEKPEWSHFHLASMTPSTFSAHGVLKDYESLLETCTSLEQRCVTAMNIDMSYTMVVESRRNIEQTNRMKKLTILATYFLPLTLTAGLFGMNFEILGQGNLPLWWYVIFAVPMVGITHFIYRWNSEGAVEHVYEWLRRKWKLR